MNRSFRLLCAAASASVTVPAVAQCPGQWQIGPFQEYPGVNGQVRSSTTWDPDGPGPQAPFLVVGGDFTIAGQAPARSIAAFDGVNWRPFGQGLPSGPDALSQLDGQLVAGGDFSGGVARWDGASWRVLGSNTTGVTGHIYALCTYNGDLVTAGDITVYSNGTTSSRGIGRWDGSIWRPLGSGITGPVYALAVYNGDLVAAGYFAQAGGNAAANIARWDGTTWTPLGSGLAGPGWGGDPAAFALAVYNGELVAGGEFGSAGGVTTGCLARWNGSQWLAFNGAINGRVSSMGTSQGRLYVGGELFQVGGVEIPSVGYYDGSAWHPAAGLTQNTSCFSEYQGVTYAGGLFTEGTLKRWNESTWVSPSRGPNATITKLRTYGHELLAQGYFDSAGGESAPGIAVWDGSQWHAFNPLPDHVRDMWNVSGTLFATGSYVLNGTEVALAYRWEGTTWVDVSAGLGGSVITMASFAGKPHAVTLASGPVGFVKSLEGAQWTTIKIVTDTPYALWPLQDDLVLSHALGIEAWDGHSWRWFAPGLGGAARVLGEYQNRLVATGDFSAGIAAFDGANWQPLGSGPGEPISDFCTYNGDLVAQGTQLHRWDGSNWRALNSIPSSYPYCVTSLDGSVFLGGSFTTVDGRLAAFWARFSDPTPDFNHDGSPATDQDIEDFFTCLAGDCCPSCDSADFDGDGDTATDADIEAFFRVLAGGAC